MEPPPVPHYQGLGTLVLDESRGHQIAWLDAPLWPPVGSVIELGNPNRDAVVLEVRLQLPQGVAPILAGPVSGALILVLVDDPIDDPGGNLAKIIPRNTAERFLRERGGES